MKCERCAKMCALAYGPDDYDALSGWMERHHHRCAPVTGAALDEARDIERQRFERHRQRDDRPTTSVTCARCHHAFISQPDGFVDEALENEIAEHQERCFVVGDWVSAAIAGTSAYGPITSVISPGVFSVEIQKSIGALVAGSKLAFGTRALRRIPRPEHTAPHAFIRGPESGPMRLGPPDETCSLCQCDPRNDIHHRLECRKPHLGAACGCTAGSPSIVPLNDLLADELDTKYDGVTLRVLLERDRFNRQENASMDPDREASPFVITATQRAAISVHWSAQLRARVQASREQERCMVRVELQCEEENPW